MMSISDRLAATSRFMRQAVFVLALLAALPAHAQLSLPAPLGLGTADGFVFEANAVSDDGGVVVGARWGQPDRSASSGGIVDGAVRWTPGTGAVTQFEDIYDAAFDYWETESTRFVAVAGDGSSALRYNVFSPYSQNGLFDEDGSLVAGGFIDTVFPGIAVSSDGQAYVASGFDGIGDAQTYINRPSSGMRIPAPVFQPGGMVDGDYDRRVATGVSGDVSTIVGRFQPLGGPGSGSEHSFLWTEAGGSTHFLPGQDTFDLRISENGEHIVGGVSTRAGDMLFRTTPTGGSAPTVSAYDYGAPDVVSDDGTVISFAGGLWIDGTGFVDLETYLASIIGLDLSAWQSMGELRDMSPDGHVLLGFGVNANGDEESWLVIVPEPGTALLLGLGLVGLNRRGRRA